MSLFWAVGGQIKSVKNTNRSYFYFLISLELRHKENKISVIRIFFNTLYIQISFSSFIWCLDKYGMCWILYCLIRNSCTAVVLKEVHPQKCLAFCNKNAITTAINNLDCLIFSSCKGGPTKPYQSRPTTMFTTPTDILRNSCLKGFFSVKLQPQL